MARLVTYREALNEAVKADTAQKRWVAMAEAVQTYLFKAILQDNLDPAKVLAVELPEKGPFGRLWHNQTWLSWKLNQSGSAGRAKFNREFFTSLKRLAKAEKVPGPANYNMIAFYLNGWKDKVPDPSLPPATLKEQLTTLEVSGFTHDSVNYNGLFVLRLGQVLFEGFVFQSQSFLVAIAVK